MKNKTVTILTQSEYFNDPRVLKQSISAKKAGFDVDVVCYQYDFGGHPLEEIVEDINIHRIVCMGKKQESMLDVSVKLIYNMLSFFPNLIQYKDVPKYIFFRFKIVIDKLIYYIRGGKNYPIVYYKHEKKDVEKTHSLYFLILNLIFSYFLSNIDIYSKSRKFKSDIYHSTDLVTLLAGFLLKKRNGGKLVYDSHELWIDSIDNYPSLIKKFLYLYEGFLIRRVDSVITVNESIANELVSRYNIKPPLVVLNCPFYSETYNVKNTYDEFNILYHGVFIKDRGLEESIKAIKYVPSNCKLFLRGYDGYVPRGVDGNYLKYLVNLVKEENLEEKVVFLKPVEMIDLVRSIDNYDIGIMPYVPTNKNQLYASPNKTFEYMMGGLAVAVSDIPEQVRFVVKNFVGKSFNPRDSRDIARVVVDMISNIDSLKQMKKNALYHAKTQYNWDVQGDKIVKLYESLL